jgi:MATE family multidrug resistance protein
MSSKHARGSAASAGSANSAVQLQQPAHRKYAPTYGQHAASVPAASAATASSSSSASAASRGFAELEEDGAEVISQQQQQQQLSASSYTIPSSVSSYSHFPPFGASLAFGAQQNSRYGSTNHNTSASEAAAVRAADSFDPSLRLNSERVLPLPSLCPCIRSAGGDDDDDDDNDIRLDALDRVARLGLPSVLALLLGGAAMLLVNVACVGHTDTSDGSTLLAGVAMGAALMLLSIGVIGGLCSCIDTLCSQAHGAGKQRLIGLIAQRTAVAYTVVILPPIGLVWLATESLLLLAQQDPTLASIAGAYTRAALPALAPLLYCEIVRRYLLAQSGANFASAAAVASSGGRGLWLGPVSSAIMHPRGAAVLSIWPQLFVPLLANVLHAVYCAVALLYPALTAGSASSAPNPGQKGAVHFGPEPAATALVMGLFAMLLLWLVYLFFFNRRLARRTCPRPWVSLLSCSRLFRGWAPLFRLGFPGMLSGAAQAAALLLVLLVAGWLPSSNGVSGLSLGLNGLVVLIALAGMGATSLSAGVGLVAGNLVGRALGAGRQQDARHLGRASIFLACIVAVLEGVLVLGLPRAVASVFTSLGEAQDFFATELSSLAAAILAADMLSGVACGVLRGLGLQSFGAHASVGSYALLGLPLGVVLAFPLHYGARGLGLGLAVASLALASMTLWRLAALDWEHEGLRAAAARLEEEEMAGVNGNNNATAGAGREAAELLAADSDIEDEGEAELRLLEQQQERRREQGWHTSF